MFGLWFVADLSVLHQFNIKHCSAQACDFVCNLWLSNVLCVTDEKELSDLGVTYTSTDNCPSKGSTVHISCIYRPESTTEDDTWDKKVFWYKDNHSLNSSHVQEHCDGKNCTLTINNLGESDSAVYKCGFKQGYNNRQYIAEPGVTLTVKGNCQHVLICLCCVDNCHKNNTSACWSQIHSCR